MKSLLSLSALAAALTLPACNRDDKACDSGDTACDTGDAEVDPYDGETYIKVVNGDCTEAAWRYDVENVGWSGGGALNIVDPGDDTNPPWNEEHDLVRGDFDEDGYYEFLYLDLPILQEPECNRDDFGAEDACWTMQEASVNTLFLCDAETKARLSWSVTIADPDDPSVALECVAWGADPAQFQGCTAFDVE